MFGGSARCVLLREGAAAHVRCVEAKLFDAAHSGVIRVYLVVSRPKVPDARTRPAERPNCQTNVEALARHHRAFAVKLP